MTLLEGVYYTLGALGIVGFLSTTVIALTWLERKALARIQQRMGPTRVGPQGLLQPIADVLKLMSKEDIVPSWSDKRLFWLAPMAFFLPALLLWVTIPVTRDLVLRNLEMGLFYIVAISVLSVAGLALAGWSSANKYALLGSLRAVGALISYEIPFILAVLAVAMLAQTFDITEIVDDQRNIAYVLILPLGLFLFFTASLAELGRTPFDIHHAESEVVGGPFVEYSGAHWAAFMLSEYANTFTVAVLTVLLFFGGWRWPTMPFEGGLHIVLSAIWLLVKTYLVILVIFWIRGTFPRLRIDQLMSFSWKVLVPLSFVNIMFIAIVLYYDLGRWVITILSLLSLAAAFWLVFNKHRSAKKHDTVQVYSVRELGLKKAEKPKLEEAAPDPQPAS